MVNVDSYLTLDIELSANRHHVYIGSNLLDSPCFLRGQIASTKVCIITNEIVGDLYLSKIQKSLVGLQVDAFILSDGEQNKNSLTLNAIYDFLIAKNHNRDTTIIALGGGVVGDIAAFAASTYQRGVRLIHIPTTLLSQVDSSIGGKTAINHKECKNLIGSFYYPHSIIIDINTLRTLPKREFISGFAEIIKYGLLVGGDFLNKLPELVAFDFLEFSQDKFDKLKAVIAASAEIKINIVKHDEQDLKGVRQLLNLGHTFAHAIEVVTNYQRYLHGEAVAIGLYLAAKLSYHLNYLRLVDLELVDNLLVKAGLPNRLPKDLDLTKLKLAMLLDKKVKNNTLPFVVIKKIGECCIESGITEDILDKVLIEAA